MDETVRIYEAWGTGDIIIRVTDSGHFFCMFGA